MTPFDGRFHKILATRRYKIELKGRLVKDYVSAADV